LECFFCHSEFFIRFLWVWLSGSGISGIVLKEVVMDGDLGKIISSVQAYFRGLCPNIGEFNGINVFLLCIFQKKNALPAWILGKKIFKKMPAYLLDLKVPSRESETKVVSWPYGCPNPS
jgi:hypothetical protein